MNPVRLLRSLRRRDDLDARGYVRGFHDKCGQYRLRPVGYDQAWCEFCDVPVIKGTAR